MGNKGSKRRAPVAEQFTRPQGLYTHRDVDHRKLRRLILDGKLAPCYLGCDEANIELEECPICFLHYPSLNRSKCCGKGICTECFLQMKSPHAARAMQCPFCKTPTYAVEFRGAKSLEEKGREQAEEQKVIEAKIRIERQELLADEERQKAKAAGLPLARDIDQEGSNATSSQPSSSSTLSTAGDPSRLPSEPSVAPWPAWGSSLTPAGINEGEPSSLAGYSNASAQPSDSIWFRGSSLGSGGIQPNHLLASGPSSFRTNLREDSREDLDLLFHFRGSRGSAPTSETTGEGLGWLRAALSPEGGGTARSGGRDASAETIEGSAASGGSGMVGRGGNSPSLSGRWMPPVLSNSSGSDEDELDVDVEELMLREAIRQSLQDFCRSSEVSENIGFAREASSLDPEPATDVSRYPSDSAQEQRATFESPESSLPSRATEDDCAFTSSTGAHQISPMEKMGGSFGGEETTSGKEEVMFRQDERDADGAVGEASLKGDPKRPAFECKGITRGSIKLPSFLAEVSDSEREDMSSSGSGSAGINSHIQLPDLLRENSIANTDFWRSQGDSIALPDLMEDEPINNANVTQGPSLRRPPSQRDFIALPDLMEDEPINVPPGSSLRRPPSQRELVALPDLVMNSNLGEVSPESYQLYRDHISLPDLMVDASIPETNLLEGSTQQNDSSAEHVTLPNLLDDAPENDGSTPVRLRSFIYGSMDGERSLRSSSGRSDIPEVDTMEELENLPQSFEEQLALAMALSLTEAEARTANTQEQTSGSEAQLTARVVC